MNNDNVTINKNDSVRRIKSFEEIKALNNINDKARTFLNSIFNELDTQKDGILQKNEGAIYIFDDGAISVTKNDKLYAAMTKNGSETRVIDNCLITKFSDGAESTMKDNKLIEGKTADKKDFTVKDGVVTFKQTPKKKEEIQTTNDTPKSETKPFKINGVKTELLNKIANEYLEIIYAPDSFSESDMNQKLNNKKALYKKYLNVFKKAINSEIKPYNWQELETDKFIMRFSPVTDPATYESYWELYDVKTKK